MKGLNIHVKGHALVKADPNDSRKAACTCGAGERVKITLTGRQRDAVVDVLNERIAGGADDLRDALGLTNKAANEMMRILDRVCNKLREKEPNNE